MPERTQNPEPDNAQLEAELIERIYNVAVRPHAYDDFMEKWGDYVHQALDDLTALKREVETGNTLRTDNLSRHFNMGFRLLEELGRSDPAAEAGGTGRVPGAASFLLDRTGHVVWYNSMASRHFGLRRVSRIDELSLWHRSRDELDKMIACLAVPGNRPVGKTVLRIHSEAADKTLFMLAEHLDNGDDGPLVQVNQIHSGWHESIGLMLSTSFGLSKAEIQIAEYLVDGADLVDIAGRRSSSINTVRTQIKALLSKMGLNSRTELVRILVSLTGVADDASAQHKHVRLGQTSRFRQRDGRMVPFHRFGPEKGRPFILFHGMLDGCDVTKTMVDLLYKNDITFFVPERPFFGSAAGVEGPIDSAPERMARDVEDLLDHLGIDTAGLVGHMAGSVYAFAAAAHLGDRASVIVSIAGGVPIVSTDQFISMSPRQRLIAYTARYTPRLLPFVLRAGIRQLDFGGEEMFMQALYANVPADLKAIRDPETVRIIAAGYHFSITQGHRAFEIDSYQVVRDWTRRVDQSDAPVLLIHGLNDPVVGFSSVEGFARSLGQRAQLIVDDDAGQLVLYKNPQAVVLALADRC